MNIDGSDWKQLTFGEVDSRPDCGPDGRSVYYTDLAAAPQSIWKVSLTEIMRAGLTTTGSCHPVVSPDGRWIACRYRDDKFTGSRIAIFPAEGGAPQAIFEFDAEWTRWANDSRSVFFTKRDRGVDNIWRQPITGGSPEQVTNFSAGLIINFDWSRDGKRLACIRGYEQNDVVLIREAR